MRRSPARGVGVGHDRSDRVIAAATLIASVEVIALLGVAGQELRCRTRAMSDLPGAGSAGPPGR